MAERKTTEIYDDLLGEGLHVAFRKASDHPAAQRAWEAISELPDSDWDAIVSFALSGSSVPEQAG